MTRAALLGLLAFFAASMSALAAESDPVVYALHVGVNEAPADTNLEGLRFADDDAARWYEFTQPLARAAVLATVLDSDSQRRHAEAVGACVPPLKASLEEQLQRLALMMRADRAAGRRVVFYFSYSGHGVLAAGGTRLALRDATIDRQWLERNVMAMPADTVHLFIDACHAADLVAARGTVIREVSAKSRPLTPHERDIVRADRMQQFPHVGALVAATADRETHEWSRYASGVFTHELLSALSGAADINGDGVIAYSEAAAFMAAASSDIRDKRAVPSVVAVPPEIDHGGTIMSLAWLRQSAFLAGPLAALGHFYVENDSGVRLIDANLEGGSAARLAIPARRRLWVRHGEQEAAMQAEPNTTVSSADLTFARSDTLRGRGSIADALQRGIFEAPYGPAYYRGWADSSGTTFAPLPRAEVSTMLTVVDEPLRWHRPVAYTALGMAALSLGAATYLGIRAHDNSSRYNGAASTFTSQSAALATRDTARHQALAADILGGAGVGIAVTGVVLMLWKDPPVVPHVTLTAGGAFIALEVP